MVFEKVVQILVDQLDADPASITMSSSVVDDLGADSLDIADIVMSIEEEFDLEVMEDQWQNMRIVGDIVRYIENKD